MRTAARPRQEATCVLGPDHVLLASVIEIAEYPAGRLGCVVQLSRDRLRERIDPRMEVPVIPADLAVGVGYVAVAVVDAEGPGRNRVDLGHVGAVESRQRGIDAEGRR